MQPKNTAIKKLKIKPCMNDLDTGLHIRPRPIIRHRTRNAANPKASFNSQNKKTNQNQISHQKYPKKFRKKKGKIRRITNCSQLVIHDPLPYRFHVAQSLNHLHFDSRFLLRL